MQRLFRWHDGLLYVNGWEILGLLCAVAFAIILVRWFWVD